MFLNGIVQSLVAVLGTIAAAAGSSPMSSQPSPSPSASPSPALDGPVVYYQAAAIHDLSAPKGEPPIYRFEGGREEFPGPPKKVRIWTRYLTPEGAELLWENLEIEDGAIKSYEMKDTAESAEGAVAVQPEKLLFFYRKEGKLSKGVEDIGDIPVVAGPGVTWLMTQNLKSLMAGEAIHFRYPVLDRQETFGFKITLQDDDPKDAPPGKKAAQLRLKANSFIVRAFVDSIDFLIDTETGQLLTIKGRCPVKKRSPKGPVEFQALTVFEPARVTRGRQR